MEIKEVFEPIISFVKNFQKKEKDISKQAAKDRLKLVLMQDRASVSPDFFEMMKKEIIDVIKKYIEIDEESLEVQLTRGYEAGLEGPALYANIPIKNIKPVASNGEELDEDGIKEITDSISDEIMDEANKFIEDGNAIVKAEIESENEAEETSEDLTEVDVDNIENNSEAENNVTEVSEEIVEVESKAEDEEKKEPVSADVIAENVAKEMKKSAAKTIAAAKASTSKKTVKKAKTTTKKATKKKTDAE